MNQERIICAAIWYKDFESPVHTVKNVKGLVLCGYRHGMIIGQCSVLSGKPQHKMGEYLQGFLTSENRFVDRVEARKIHLSNGGTSEFDDELYSEDLY
jgi:hypothetical protein